MSSEPLTKREQIIFDEFKRRQKVSLQELIEIVKGQKSASPDFIKSSVLGSVKYLGYKIAHLGYYIERVSGKGRGVHAVFELKKLK